MTDAQLPRVAAMGLVIGAVSGMVGTFAPSDSLRGLAWGLDGTALTVAAALLTIHHVRRGHEILAAGFLVFAIGEGFILSTSAMDLAASVPLFGGGVALWAVSMALVSTSRMIPVLVRVTGVVGSVLFALVAAQIFGGVPLTPLSQPLPFFAYPFLAMTLCGWAWVHRGAAS